MWVLGPESDPLQEQCMLLPAKLPLHFPGFCFAIRTKNAISFLFLLKPLTVSYGVQ